MNRIINWIKTHRLASGIIAFALLWILATEGAFLKRDFSQKSETSTASFGTTGLAIGAPDMYMMDSDDMAMAEESMALKASGRFMPPFEPTAGETAAEVDQRIIKTGNITAVFESVDESMADLTSYASEVGGFIGHSSVNEKGDGTRSGRLSMRVPVAEFESSLAYVRNLSDFVRHESVDGQDVTEQYTDLQARLKNARAQEAAYLAVLDKASTVEDILKVQRELGNIRSQIESLEGRLKYLENKTSFSTIDVVLEEDTHIQIPTGKFKPLTAAKQAVAALVNAFQGVVISLIWAVVLGLGLAVPALLAAWVLYRIIKKFWWKK